MLPQPARWCDDADDPEPPGRDVLYRLAPARVTAQTARFATALQKYTRAYRDSHADMVRDATDICKGLQTGKLPPPPDWDASALREILSLYTSGQNQLVVLTTGVLRMLQVTNIGFVHREALQLIVDNASLDLSNSRCRARIKLMQKSNSAAKRAVSQHAIRHLNMCEARFQMRVTSAVLGAVPARDTPKSLRLWQDCAPPADASINRELHAVLSALIAHKRSIDWELDEMAAAQACRRFVGGPRGTPSG